MKERSLIWVGSEVAGISGLGRVFSMAGGKVVDGGRATTPSSACSARSRSLSGVDRSNLKLRGFTSERIYFEPGQTDFRQGEAGDKAWIVADGAADVFPTLLEENRVIAVHVTRAVAGRLGTTLRDYGRVATMS